MKTIVGLTGGIASGKSTVSQILTKLGAIVIDADKIARQIVEQGRPALEKIRICFGDKVLFKDGSLNRKKLAQLVFNDASALNQLNEITHPYIIEEIKKEIYWHSHNSPVSVIIIDAALLIEMELTGLVDEVWLVAVPMELQRHRLHEREAISPKEADKRIAAQMSLEEKMAYADYVIDNSGGLEELEENVKGLWQKLTKK